MGKLLTSGKLESLVKKTGSNTPAMSMH